MLGAFRLFIIVATVSLVSGCAGLANMKEVQFQADAKPDRARDAYRFVRMKMLMVKLAIVLIFLFFTLTASAASKNDVIVFDIVDSDEVLVNGESSDIKNSWLLASKYISPHVTNYYRIEFDLRYIQQANEIERSMNILAKMTEVVIRKE